MLSQTSQKKTAFMPSHFLFKIQYQIPTKIKHTANIPVQLHFTFLGIHDELYKPRLSNCKHYMHSLSTYANEKL